MSDGFIAYFSYIVNVRKRIYDTEYYVTWLQCYVIESVKAYTNVETDFT